MIFVFAKTPDDLTASLAKKLNEVVAANADNKLAAVINFTGEQSDEFQKKIGEFAEQHELQNLTLAVTAEADKFNISDDASVTVMHYLGKEVKALHSTDKVDDEAIAAIVEGVDKILP